MPGLYFPDYSCKTTSYWKGWERFLGAGTRGRELRARKREQKTYKVDLFLII